MNGDLIPATVAAGGGSAMIAGIWLRERRQTEAMRASMVRLSARFPIGLEPAQALAALDGLSGLPRAIELIFEVAAREGSILHGVWVPAAVHESVRSTMTAAVPSLRLSEAELSPADAVRLSLRLHVATPSLLSGENAVSASRSLLTGLAGLRSGEQVVIRWALRPGSAKSRPEADNPTQREREIERAWQRKTSVPGFTACGLVLIRASKARARELASHIENVLRGRRGLAGGIRVTSERGNRRLSSLPRTTRSSGWLSTVELLPLLGVPLGPDVVAGVEVGASRELQTPRHVAREGRQLFVGRDSAGARPVALSAEASRQHLAIVGPCGAGKSVVLAHGILDDLAHGYGGVLIDPKADLLNDVLDRIPAALADRVVVLDPAASGLVPGLDLFGAGDRDLRADVILSVLRGLSESWGPRIDQYLRLGLRTVAELPNPTLADWLGLYSEPALRRDAVARLDPMLVGQWRTYESMSTAQQQEFVAPAVSRIATLLSRPALRNVINQPNPKLSIARLLDERRWLLVSLSPGTLGEPAARLIGAIVTYLVWAAVEARVTLAPERRHPVFLYFDELQSVSHLPIGLEQFFERTRGLGCGVVVATQALARLPESVRQSLLGNVGSLIAFKAGAEEATRIARELPGLGAEDIMSLSRYEVAARVNTAGAGSGSAVVTGYTEPLPPVTGQAEIIRRLSAERYGREPRDIEEELARRAQGEASDDGRLGQVRRAT